MKRITVIGLGAAVCLSLLYIEKIPLLATGSAEQADGAKAGKGLFAVLGKAKCIAGNKAIIAPTVLHPVDEIHVALGDRVKKGDKLVQLDADEPKADVRAKEANLEAA